MAKVFRLQYEIIIKLLMPLSLFVGNKNATYNPQHFTIQRKVGITQEDKPTDASLNCSRTRNGHGPHDQHFTNSEMDREEEAPICRLIILLSPEQSSLPSKSNGEMVLLLFVR